MADETRLLAQFAAGLQHSEVPSDVRAAMLDIVVDQVGCEIGGSGLPWARQVHGAWSAVAGGAEATVARYGTRLSCMAAAFVNSTFGHSFEYDDINPRIHGHPGAELVPSLFAVAERGGLPGKKYLTALVAGYELRGRIGWALSPDMIERGGPQYSTTCGPFGVAGGVAVLLELGADGVRNAMGIAGAHSGGLMQYTLGGGSVKRLYTAVAASSGIQAALLAQAGISGPEGILEGERGLLRIYGKTCKPERLTSELGTRWMVEGRGFKPHCCCGAIHPAIEALRRILAETRLAPDQIDAIEVGYPSGTHLQAAITHPRDILEMQFSTAYSLALAVLKGGNSPVHYSEASLADPDIQGFAAKVKVREDRELGGLDEGKQPARVRVTARSGQTMEMRVDEPKGTSGTPMTRAEIDDKFRSQAFPVLGDAAGEQLFQSLRGIEDEKDIRRIAPMLVAHE